MKFINLLLILSFSIATFAQDSFDEDSEFDDSSFLEEFEIRSQRAS